MTAYDLAIIGAGPGGLACALKALELGLTCFLLEKGQTAYQGIMGPYPRERKSIRRSPRGDAVLFR
ncbi:MAG: NAD(P)-binding domain-containing protein [Deltaproteobacteria bacterium]|nr:NAD(P)-binding domain-containing protein [Deltaproteobacteria bacterium]